ncbi:unnamed protein product [Rhizophagus irregularis]|nr:unnamed protein product [Rhizophagus irregularis]
MLIYKNLDSFIHKKVMKMLETLVSRNSIVDNNVDVDKLFKTEQYSFIPPSLGIFFLIIKLYFTLNNNGRLSNELENVLNRGDGMEIYSNS